MPRLRRPRRGANPVRTFAAFAPSSRGTLDEGQRAAQMRLLDSKNSCGNPRFAGACCEKEPRRAGVRAAQLLAGPGLAGNQTGCGGTAEACTATSGAPPRSAATPRQIARPGEFAEYFEAVPGKTIGSQKPVLDGRGSAWTGRPQPPITAAKQASRGNTGPGDKKARGRPRCRRGRTLPRPLYLGGRFARDRRPTMFADPHHSALGRPS